MSPPLRFPTAPGSAKGRFTGSTGHLFLNTDVRRSDRRFCAPDFPLQPALFDCQRRWRSWPYSTDTVLFPDDSSKAKNCCNEKHAFFLNNFKTYVYDYLKYNNYYFLCIYFSEYFG